MDRILKIITLETKRKNFIKSAVINVGMLILILPLFLIIDKSIDISYLMLRIIPYMCLGSFCFSLSQEFSNKTDRIVFTGVFSRSEIIISKLISFGIIALINFICYEIMIVIFSIYRGQYILQFLNIKILANNLYVFLIYSFTLGTFILLVSVVTTNGMLTGIITYGLYFDLILAFLGQALEAKGNEMVKYIIGHLPFYSANTGFYSLRYNFEQSLVMIISGCIFFTLACVIINKKNI